MTTRLMRLVVLAGCLHCLLALCEASQFQSGGYTPEAEADRVAELPGLEDKLVSGLFSG